MHLELTPAAAARLDGLRAELGAASRAEVIRQALQLYEWMVAERKDGARFWKGGSLETAAEVVLFKW